MKASLFISYIQIQAGVKEEKVSVKLEVELHFNNFSCKNGHYIEHCAGQTGVCVRLCEREKFPGWEIFVLLMRVEMNGQSPQTLNPFSVSHTSDTSFKTFFISYNSLYITYTILYMINKYMKWRYNI